MYLKNLIKKTQDLKLSEQDYWNLLLHYQSSGEGYESTIDDPRFFLSQKGRTDPDAEMEATLRGFFAAPVAENQHMRCRFVARYTWLKKELTINEARLPMVRCPDFEKMLLEMNARSVALIFPVAYINNPASMFGHTFLRIDGNSESTLLSTALNYGAKTNEQTGISYVLKGISGGFHGYYDSRPYHEKIREYTTIEDRDIWEYTLNLREEEVRRIVLHIWEMRDLYSEYYFFDENCSFAVLYLLEVARPSLQLLNETNRFLVLPISTIRTVVNAGIVTQITYRPSQGTTIRKIAETLSKEEQRLAYDIATGDTDPAAISIPENSLNSTLDLASEYIQYLASRRMIDGEEYLSRFHNALEEKGKQKQASGDLFEDPHSIPPNQGHLPSRIGVGGGCRSTSCFSEINLRLGYHDLLDNDKGYLKYSQINFMKIIARYKFKEQSLDIYNIQILDIISLAPQDLFFSPLAWKAKMGLQQKILPDRKEHLVTNLSLGAGLSTRIWETITYTLAEIELNVSQSFSDGATFGTGLSAGILASPTSLWKIHVSLRSISPLLGDPYRTLRGEVAQSFIVNKDASVSAIISREKIKNGDYSEVKLKWNIYF
ncbi:MAG: DUF4105 domain-containing protein [Nitrospirae bacterium]|nr:DUF4105 domain-containing protein [Candidatus Manganitrophaceae bacterium]